MTKSDKVSIREVYDLLQDFRKEMKDELMPPLNQLRDSFIALEQGRLTRNEQKTADIEVELIALKSSIEGSMTGVNKLIVYAGIIISMIVGVLGLFLKLR